MCAIAFCDWPTRATFLRENDYAAVIHGLSLHSRSRSLPRLLFERARVWIANRGSLLIAMCACVRAYMRAWPRERVRAYVRACLRA